jgi:hypothetical protein
MYGVVHSAVQSHMPAEVTNSTSSNYSQYSQYPSSSTALINIGSAHSFEINSEDTAAQKLAGHLNQASNYAGSAFI